MRILITGAFGNIGKAVIDEANRRHHEVTVFEIDNKKTRKDAQKYHSEIKKVLFGDIRNPEDVKKAIQEADAVIHLAAIIPPTSKKNRDLTMAVNCGGTVNLVAAIKETRRSIPLIFTSSASVMGATQLQDKLVNRNDPLVVTGNYEESKIRCEEYLKSDTDNYLIFRLAGVLPTITIRQIKAIFPLFEEIFSMHRDMRLEMITAEDVATALVAGAEKLASNSTPKNQAYILGGGAKNGWQLKGSDFLTRLFGSFSLPVPNEKYFTPDINTYHLDWYDTEEVQREFNYQNHSLDDFLKSLSGTFWAFKLPIILAQGIIIHEIEKMSPYR
jgi:UDP-glucose 4-epimerase